MMRNTLAVTATLLTVALLAGCAGQRQTLGAALAYRGVDWPSDRTLLDLAYRDGAEFDDEKHRLDLFLPAEGTTDWPTLVFVHGGGWTHGDRRLGALGIEPMRNLGRFYAARGYGVVVPSYRLQPGVDWAAQIDDVAAAVAWARENVGRFGGDPDAIALGGHSAGAWLAARVGLADAPLARHGTDRDGLCGLVLVSGAGYDLADEATYAAGASRAYFERRFAGEGDWEAQASVVTNVDAPAPPSLLLTAEGEGPTFERQSNRLYEVVAPLSPRSKRHEVAGQDHQRILVSMSLEGDPASETALAFLAETDCARASR
ncbi:MAG: alpha/beta hydrolase [Myxococcota bacterium]